MNLSSLVRLVFLFAVAAAHAVAQSYTFANLAGQPPQNGGTDGSLANARFDTPTGVCIDGAGNIFIADTYNYTVRRITPAGVVSTFAGVAGAKGSDDGTGDQARFGQIFGIAVDSSGNVYVADYDFHTIRKITPARVVTTLAGLAGTSGSAEGTGSAARFKVPVGLALDSEGTLYIADRGNGVIRKLSPAGVVTNFAGTPGVFGSNDGPGATARFGSLSYMAFDLSGNLLVTDNANSVIRKVTPAGVVSTFAGATGLTGTANGIGTAARFNFPDGIACDRFGNIFVADTTNHTIRLIVGEGTVSTLVGTPGLSGGADGSGTTARFYRPYGIAVDAAGSLVVVDTGNHTIRKVVPPNTVSTLAGPGGSFGSSDGTGTGARFYYPQGATFDRTGNLYVTDAYNTTIRKVTPGGSVTTVAGAPGTFNYLDGLAANARFVYPNGIACTSTGTLYISDSVFHTIRALTPSGEVRTVAGVAGITPGSNDGTGLLARFNQPWGIAVDHDDNLYIADTGNHTIRKLTPAGVVSTVAGLATVRGSADGASSAARFSAPLGVAVDAAGVVYVADTSNHTIRKIAADGTVSTVAGTAGTRGSQDGPAATALFSGPATLAFDSAGNLYIGDSNNYTIRKLTPDGIVSTIGGLAGQSGSALGAGASSRFSVIVGLALDANDTLYVVDQNNNRIARGALDAQPVVTAQPQSLTITPGSRVTFTVAATGGGLSYQWKFNGTAITGATGTTYTLNGTSAASAGSYTVDLANSAGTLTSRAAVLSVITTANVGRITNLAIRSQAGTDAQVLIVGVAIGGSGTTGTKPVLIRAVGPTLGAFGVPGALADPRLDLYAGVNKINENDDWAGDAQIAAIGTAVGAFSLSAPASKDAALYNPAFARGTYSVQVAGKGATTGVALAEIYDGTPAGSFGASTPRLTNVSARTQVGIGDDILIAGFTIGGLTSKTVLIRAVGPTLTSFGVPGALADPHLALFSSTERIDENDDWGGSAAIASTFLTVGAFPLAAASHDAVLLVTLAPGSYTAQVRGVGNTTGVALVEVYEVP